MVRTAPDAVDDPAPTNTDVLADDPVAVNVEAETATQPPVGVEVRDAFRAIVVPEPEAAVIMPTFTLTADSTFGDDVWVVALIDTTVAAAFAPTGAAVAGTTDKSPNPSEATATADTFFNEIVFTIFLSFSQIKDDLLPGW